MTERILLVDDDPNVLAGYKRHLRKQFEVVLAEGGPEALELLQSEEPFAVVVSDMQMPDIDGLQLLSQVAELHPDTVRVMLTGNADQKTAIDAVNQGNIFRFLTKPCSAELLAGVLEAALGRYRLVQSEHELLSKTLSGSVSLMVQMLSMSNPTAYGQGSRVRTTARNVAQWLGLPNVWEVEIAAMLSQIGCVSLPPAVLEKALAGDTLTPDEQRMWDEHPKTGSELVKKIPRLEGAADMIALQHYEGGGDDISAGAQVLRAVLDHDALASHSTPTAALQTMLTERAGQYDPDVLRALSEQVTVEYRTREVSVAELRDGMVFDQNVETLEGNVLIAKGQEVSASLIERLRNFDKSAHGVRQPIRVRCFHAAQTQESQAAAGALL